MSSSTVLLKSCLHFESVLETFPKLALSDLWRNPDQQQLIALLDWSSIEATNVNKELPANLDCFSVNKKMTCLLLLWEYLVQIVFFIM